MEVADDESFVAVNLVGENLLGPERKDSELLEEIEAEHA